MQERAEILRCRVALDRRDLAEGVGVDLARLYLEEIMAAETELAQFEGQDYNKRC